MRHYLKTQFFLNSRYEYSRSNKDQGDIQRRCWRKNRNINMGKCERRCKKGCIGVDLNRNWGYKWGNEGSSEDPCE